MKLWLDDTRPAPEGWTRAHTAREAIDFIDTNDITALSLDHDLGAADGELWAAGTSEETGMMVVEHIVKTGRVDPSVPVRVHSWNPSGARRMAAALSAKGFTVNIYPFNLQDLGL